MSAEHERIKGFDVFVENLKLVFAKQGLSVIFEKSDEYYGGRGEEYVLEVVSGAEARGQFFHLVYLTKEEISKKLDNLDFGVEDADVLVFSMPVIGVELSSSEVPTEEEIQAFDKFLYTKVREVRLKAGNLGNMYLAIHLEDRGYSINLDAEWTNVEKLGIITNEVVNGVKSYGKLVTLIN